MKILKKISKTKRITERYSIAKGVFSNIVCFQEKRWWGWKIVSWLYTNQCETVDEYEDWFNWDINENKKKAYGKKQFTQ